MVFALSFCQVSAQAVKIIPEPESIVYGEGVFKLGTQTKVIASPELENEADFLVGILESGFGSKPKTAKKGKGIVLQFDNSLLESMGEEGYSLSVTSGGVNISAATPAGVFYGIQSFRQLLPQDFEFVNCEGVEIPVLDISDSPRFPWRAFMLDESRHFKGMAEVKKLLDQMALLKLNTFHWHLTDDQGWRIEIKKYPKLTEVGGKRKDTQTSFRSEERTGVPHEGFYTQEQIKEVIAYAADRHITIVPEIEMPGHAMAAVAAYPWLGSLGTTTEVSEIFGKMDDSFRISDPEVVSFLKDVLDEVMALFPGEVIHVGGDEVNLKPWEESEDVQAFMKAKDLNSPVDLQIYFTNEISSYVDAAGKRMMGWNDIMGDDIHEEREGQDTKVEQELAKSAIVHFWKGDLKLITRAVQDGYDVVNSNHWDTYLDYTFKRTPLSKSYAFNPIPEGLDEKYHHHILGLGTQMWSEWIPEVSQMQRQVFPRLAIYAEVGWTQLENKDFDRFSESLESLKTRWKLEGINYYDGE
ncbi:hexosaminidase [Marinoscillum furvescens DSM 4134]|uniref:beta-N-acetylhexosaminidase n=2 Tax=Marinoscillum furvescens TaxID=1026 RepID=A0A3D9LJ26_MARFU|nr:hexosaminidase [Marinoscillum furvescens DSM 4134]